MSDRRRATSGETYLCVHLPQCRLALFRDIELSILFVLLWIDLFLLAVVLLAIPLEDSGIVERRPHWPRHYDGEGSCKLVANGRGHGAGG